MGTDLYLFRLNKTDTIDLTDLFGKHRDDGVAYWRKADYIYDFFYKHLYKKVDEDSNIPKQVSKELLLLLQEKCRKFVERYKQNDYNQFPSKEYRVCLDTITIIDDVLETTDFDDEVLWYVPIL